MTISPCWKGLRVRNAFNQSRLSEPKVRRQLLLRLLDSVEQSLTLKGAIHFECHELR